MRHLNGQERSELLQGPPELRAKQSADWDYIGERIRASDNPFYVFSRYLTDFRVEFLSVLDPDWST